MEQQLVHLEKKLDNSIIEREKRVVSRENKKLAKEVELATTTATIKAKKERLEDLVLEHFHNNPTAPIEIECKNKSVKRYFPAIGVRKNKVGERQIKKRVKILDNFLGTQEKRIKNLQTIRVSKLGEEISEYIPSKAPTSKQEVLALWAHKKLSLEQIQKCRLAGWNAASIQEVMDLAATHKIPVESKTCKK